MLIHTIALAQYLRAESKTDKVAMMRHGRYMVGTVMILPDACRDFYQLFSADRSDVCPRNLRKNSRNSPEKDLTNDIVLYILYTITGVRIVGKRSQVVVPIKSFLVLFAEKWFRPKGIV